MTDRLQKLLELSDQSEKAELSLANNGWVKAMTAYKDKPGKQTKEDLDASRAFLDETRERLTAKYFPEDAPAPEGERFKNRKQAHNWLTSQGYKVSNGKFYKDCDEGFPPIHKDGSVSRYQVLQYAQQQDVERRGSAPAGDGEDYDARSVKAKALQEEIKLEKMQREHDAEWLHADAAWSALAALVGAIQDSLRHHFHTGQGQIIHAAGGEPARGPEVYEACEELLGAAFNEVAGMGRIDGVFEVDDED